MKCFGCLFALGFFSFSFPSLTWENEAGRRKLSSTRLLLYWSSALWQACLHLCDPKPQGIESDFSTVESLQVPWDFLTLAFKNPGWWFFLLWFFFMRGGFVVVVLLFFVWFDLVDWLVFFLRLWKKTWKTETGDLKASKEKKEERKKIHLRNKNPW